MHNVKYAIKLTILQLSVIIGMIMYIKMNIRMKQLLPLLRWVHNPNFYVDSEATTHMTNEFGKLSYAKSYNMQEVIHVCNGNKMSISHTSYAFL